MHDKLLWLNEDNQFMFHKNIVEYDMVAASLSICEEYKLLDDEKIKHMKLLPKDKRSREMGMMQKDEQFSKTLISLIKEVREIFIQQNNIKDENIISLHSDAIFFETKKEIKTHVNSIEFKLKHNWCSYINYKGIEMFYSDTDNMITFKNIPQDKVKQHTIGINRYLTNIFYKLENYDKSLLRDMSKFQSMYLQDKFPEHYYIPFGKGITYKLSNLELFAYVVNIVLEEMKGW